MSPPARSAGSRRDPRAPVRLAVFDCDGTLVDGQAAVCAAMERAFAALSRPAPARSRIRRIVGLSLPQAMQQLAPELPHGELPLLVGAYQEAFRAARADGTLREPLFAGMGEMLVRLHGRGVALAVATGKSDRGLAATLAAHGIAHLFGALHTADRHPSKPHPAMLEAAMAEAGAGPDETVMIGDTTYDIQMAGAAGTRAIGVAWGYHEAAELLAAGALAVVASAAELEDCLA